MSVPQVIGAYQLKAQIARGGQSQVWIALRTGPGGFRRRCALKLLLPPTSTDSAARKAFIAEARLMASFDHPNLVAIDDLGEAEGHPIVYSVMPYVSGMALSTIVDTMVPQFEPPHAVWIVARALLGLDFAHKLEDDRGRPLGVIHRDVSPENILVGFDGQVRLIDFGIAISTISPRSTRVHVVKGKLEYLSPEQASASPRIDTTTDIYSMGLVLYNMLTGTTPLRGEPTTALERARNPDIKRLSGLIMCPSELDRLVHGMLARRAADRPNDAGVLAQELLAVLQTMHPNYNEVTFAEWTKRALATEISKERTFLGAISKGTQVINTTDYQNENSKLQAGRQPVGTPLLDGETENMLDEPDETEKIKTPRRPIVADRTRDDLHDILAELDEVYDK